jgi:ABC-2 type transport system ATP-binding protein
MKLDWPANATAWRRVQRDFRTGRTPSPAQSRRRNRAHPRLPPEPGFGYARSVSLIEIENLTRGYGRRRGVDNVSLAVAEGELFGFLGPNGAGKTTTIRVLLGFLRPSGGSARIFGFDCWRDGRAIRRDVGYIPGDLRLPAWMNGSAALSIFGAVRGCDLTRAGGELAETFDLDLRVKVRDMSRGMRQKLGLILALAHAPRLLILDEPTSALDPLMQRVLQDLLRRRAAAGNTVFFSSHSLGEVEQLCDRVAIVRDGILVADDSLAELRDRAGHDVMIRWNDEGSAPGIDPPGFLTVTRRQGAVWHGTLEGPAHRLVDFLAGKGVAELNIGPPDLESLFARFYQHGEEVRK